MARDSYTVKPPVTMRKSNDRRGDYWYLECRYCPWSARTGDKIGAQEEKRSHTKTCFHYLKKIGLR
jgi:hypothetical protein